MIDLIPVLFLFVVMFLLLLLFNDLYLKKCEQCDGLRTKYRNELIRSCHLNNKLVRHIDLINDLKVEMEAISSD